jgi:hypothetical protein
MIVTNQVHRCRDCGSEHIVRNGRNRCRSQQYLCHECGGASKVHAQKGALQRGAQGRGAAGLPGAHLASWAEPGLRGLTQDDHCMAEKNS